MASEIVAPSSRLVCVYRAAHSIDAHLVADRLIDLGIQARLLGECLDMGFGGVASASFLTWTSSYLLQQSTIFRHHSAVLVVLRPRNLPCAISPELSGNH